MRIKSSELLDGLLKKVWAERAQGDLARINEKTAPSYWFIHSIDRSMDMEPLDFVVPAMSFAMENPGKEIWQVEAYLIDDDKMNSGDGPDPEEHIYVYFFMAGTEDECSKRILDCMSTN